MKDLRTKDDQNKNYFFKIPVRWKDWPDTSKTINRIMKIVLFYVWKNFEYCNHQRRSFCHKNRLICKMTQIKNHKFWGIRNRRMTNFISHHFLIQIKYYNFKMLPETFYWVVKIWNTVKFCHCNKHFIKFLIMKS